MLEDGEITKDAMELYNLSKLAPPIPRKQVDVGDEDLYMFVLDFEDGKVYKYLYPEAVENEEGKVVKVVSPKTLPIDIDIVNWIGEK